MTADWQPTHQHVKRGTTYEVIGIARFQNSGPPAVDGTSVMIYRGEDGRLWIRSAAEFADGRFVALPAPPPATEAG